LISLFKDTVYYTISKIVPGLSGFFAVILFVRIVGPQEYGQYSLLLSQCNLIVAVGFGWLNQANLRYYSKDNKHHEYNYSQLSAFFYSCLISLFVLILLVISQSLSIKLSLICSLSILGLGSFNYIKTFFQAMLKPLKVIWLTFNHSLLALLIPLLMLFVFYKSGYIILIGVGLSSIIITLFFINKIKTVDIFKNKTIKSKKLISKWFLYGGPLSIWFAAGLALPFLDRFFINHYLTSEELGIYASAHELLTKIFSLIIFPLTMAIHPRIMNYWNESNKYDAIKLIKWGIAILGLIGLFLFVFLLSLDNIFFIIMNKLIPQFRIEYKVIIIPLILAGFLWQLSFLTHKVLELREKTHIMVFFIIISLVINLIGNIYFIPIFGLVATAYTAFISSFTYCFLTYIYSIIAMKQLDL
jgi:O-antigen/teichoic acid export membrane protein